MARVATRRDERGQLLLVAALALGVLLVALALIVSTAIHTEAVSTQGSDALHDERAAVSYQESAHRGVAGIVGRVNENGSASHDELAENLSAGVVEWNDAAARGYARDGTAANASLVGVTDGTRVAQDDARDFGNRSGSSEWTVAESASNVREFRMNVSADALAEPANETCTGSDGCLTVEVEDETGADPWRMFVYSSDENTTSVRVTPPSGDDGVCDASGELVEIDVTAGTVDGEDCEYLTFAENVSTPYDVAFANADAVVGTYELTVDRELSADPHFDVDGSPTVEPAIYAANVSVTYRSPNLVYETEIRVAPGEGDG